MLADPATSGREKERENEAKEMERCWIRRKDRVKKDRKKDNEEVFELEAGEDRWGRRKRDI